MRPLVRVVPALAVAAVVLAACGGDDSGQDGDGDARRRPPEADAGEDVFEAKGCASCHGTGIGPELEGIYGADVELADGSTVTVDDAYLAQAITDPSSQRVDGYDVKMPSVDVSDEEVGQLIAYIRSLGGGDDQATGGDAATVGIMRDPAPAVGDVSLPDLGSDERFAFRADPGKVLLVFFGFTNCPDVCPGTMANVKIALGRLGDRAADVDVAMVTVDPDRDLATLADYVQTYVPTAHALGTSDPVRLQRAADAFGVTYTVQDLAGGKAEVGHSSHLFGVDDTGKLVITWTFPTAPSDLASDLTYLLDRA